MNFFLGGGRLRNEEWHARTSRSRKHELIDEYECSGLTGPKLAALGGNKSPAFVYWMQLRRKVSQTALQKPSVSKVDSVRCLVAVVVQAALSAASSPLAIHPPGNATHGTSQKN